MKNSSAVSYLIQNKFKCNLRCMQAYAMEFSLVVMEGSYMAHPKHNKNAPSLRPVDNH